MWESTYISLTEAAEIVSLRADCDGRRAIEAAWEEGVIAVERRSWEGNLFWSRAPGEKPNGSYVWREAPPTPIEWYHNPYNPSGIRPDKDLRVRRADITELWPLQSVSENQTHILAALKTENVTDSLRDQSVERESARDRIEKVWYTISHKYDLERRGSRKEAEGEIVKITGEKDSTVHKYLSLIAPTGRNFRS